MGSKKHKGSTATKAVVHQAHEERTDINVDGSIAGGACVVDAATIEGTNATGDSTIEVDVANITNTAAAGDAFMVEDVNFVMVSYDRCCVIFLVF
jgi:hypothetical protein